MIDRPFLWEEMRIQCLGTTGEQVLRGIVTLTQMLTRTQPVHQSTWLHLQRPPLRQECPGRLTLALTSANWNSTPTPALIVMRLPTETQFQLFTDVCNLVPNQTSLMLPPSQPQNSFILSIDPTLNPAVCVTIKLVQS